MHSVLIALKAQADNAKWNEEETYRFLLRFYGKSAVLSTESFSAQGAVQQLYQMGRYDSACTHTSYLTVNMERHIVLLMT